MQISTEGKLGLVVGLVGLGGAGAVVIAPAIGWVLIGIAAIGGVALAFHHFGEALALIWNPGNNARMIALVGMIAYGIGAIVFAGIYFWPRTSTPPPHAIISEPPPAPAQLPSSPAPSSASNPVLIEPPQSVLKNPDGSQRIFIRVLPHEISAAFEGRTTNQAMTLVAPYLLKWIAISAIVHNVKTYEDGTTFVHFISVLNQTTVTVTSAEFGPKWRDNLSVVNKGDTLKVVCRISKIEQSIINVDSCEIITP
jgi:hypothetical protein